MPQETTSIKCLGPRWTDLAMQMMSEAFGCRVDLGLRSPNIMVVHRRCTAAEIGSVIPEAVPYEILDPAPAEPALAG